MTKEVQFRRGTTTQHSTFTGALAEVTVDTDLDVVVVHDGVTAGGQQMVGRTATQTLTNKTLTSPAINGGTINNASIGATTRNSGAFTSLDANGNVILGSDSADTVTINGTINQSIILGTGAQIQGPSTLVIDPAVVGNDTGTVQIKGNLEVLGTTTTIDSTTMTINDPLIVLGDGQTTAAGVDTGGFTLGTTGIGIQYNNTGSRFDSTEDFNLASGKAYEINGSVVLSSSAVLGKTIGGTAAGDIVSIDGTQTLSGKTLTAPRFVDTGFIADSNGNELLEFGVVANAVNEVKITNAATGVTGPLIEVAGETNVNLRLNAAGTGDIVLGHSLKPIAGTTSKAPIHLTSGVLLSAASAGAIEWDGTAFYASPANNNRGALETSHYIVLNATNTLTSQTAVQPLFDGGGGPAGGAITLPVGLYVFECVFALTGMSTGVSGSFGFALGGTAVKTETWEAMAKKTAALTTLSTSELTWNTAANAALTTANLNATGVARIRGHFRVTTTGTIIPQVSLGVASAAVVQTNSFFRCAPMSATSTTVTIGNWA